ncbi:DUF2577 family protein [Fusobacterium perfoetens]|uniref:DUF2577 family protein n=1 Tax=Fusobacterium perfoetens TaxID=852 RepID=UPI001F1B89B8|nr:DUF2577 family protein [Fusobacterium perfoetens]MCF2626265.1 DUF2577 family protein [Fusobacterium perfoetens]
MNKTEKYHKSIVKLAEIIKKRDNPLWLGAVTGEVVKAPPELEVKLENGIIIKNHKIMISIEKIVGYERTYSLKGNISQYDFENTTSSEPVSTHPAHPIKKLSGKGTYSAEGTIQWTDTLKVGDKVLMLPTNKEEYFYLIDRVVRL